MNIIKLKDIILPSECRFSKFFNENLKGKYAYWIQMRYIFPMDSLDYTSYIQYEQLDPIDFLKPTILPHIDLYSEECCMYNFSQKYIDCEATGIANDINEYKIANSHVTDADIDMLKLRNFRSWLATEILMLNTCVDGTYLDKLTENQIHMLEYYKNDMYNEVVKQLSIFGKENAFSITSNSKSCGCCSTNLSGLYNSNGQFICDALTTYTKNLHKLMVQTFEDASFWMSLNTDFIEVFKKYIDNIIATGLIINTSTDNVLYSTCNCNANTNVSTTILKNLSDALQYIIDDNVTGHINFIHDALYNWAEQLYDKMSWNLK